jgi:hypothetical protein
MFRQYSVPAPKQRFDVDPVMFDELAAAVAENDGSFSLTLGEPIEPQLEGQREEEIWTLAQPLTRDCSRALGRKATLLQLFYEEVAPNSSHLQELWHNDVGMNKGLVIPNRLPTQFAVGKIPKDQRLIIENANRSRYDQRVPAFNGAVEHAIETGALRVVSGGPYSATLFTRKHIHRSPINETGETIKRFLAKVSEAV